MIVPVMYKYCLQNRECVVTVMIKLTAKVYEVLHFKVCSSRNDDLRRLSLKSSEMCYSMIRHVSSCQ